jgi:hypothetical protein
MRKSRNTPFHPPNQPPTLHIAHAQPTLFRYGRRETVSIALLPCCERARSVMITSFFQPTSKKVRPVASADGPDCPPEKRERDGEDAESNKRAKTTDESSTSSSPSSSSPSNNNTPEVQELLSLLDDSHDGDEKTWRDVLGKCFSSPSFAKLASFVSKER